MKILSITSDNGVGGIQKVSKLLTKSLSDNHEIYNLVFSSRKSEVEYLNLYKVNDLVKFKILKPLNVFHRLIKSYAFFRNHIFDYLVINNYSNIFFRRIIKSKNYVLYLHTDPLRKKNFYNYVLLQYAKEKFDSYICVSEGLKSTFVYHLKYQKDKIKVIYNPAVTKELKQLKSNNKFRILSVGRYEAEKGHLHLINALSLLNPSYQIEVFIIGSGPLKSNYIKLIDDLNLNHVVKLIPWTTNIEEYYLTSDLFILTSYYETYSMVLAEAISYGLDIITTDCPTGPREIFNSAKTSRVSKTIVRGNLLDNFANLNNFEIRKNERYLAKLIENRILDNDASTDIFLDADKITDYEKYRQIINSFFI